VASGLFGLLDDVAALARLAATSLDDVGAAAGRATTKASGLLIDDAAVTPQYVRGLAAERELPIILRITRGSFRNKLLIILPAALLLSEFLPWLLTPILMLGGAYLCYEAVHKIWEAVTGHDHGAHEDAAPKSEDEVVAGAIRTDLILSAEIMVIALDEVAAEGFVSRAAILLVVAIAITVLVYGVVALIVKMDDVGLHLAEGEGLSASFGRRLGSVPQPPELLGVALPLLGDLHVGRQEHLRARTAPRAPGGPRSPRRLEVRAALADHDALLRVALDVDDRVDARAGRRGARRARTSSTVTAIECGSSCCSRGDQLLAQDLGGELPLGLVGDRGPWAEQPRPLGQVADEHVDQVSTLSPVSADTGTMSANSRAPPRAAASSVELGQQRCLSASRSTLLATATIGVRPRRARRPGTVARAEPPATSTRKQIRSTPAQVSRTRAR
jgi:uncharacterized protein